MIGTAKIYSKVYSFSRWAVLIGLGIYFYYAVDLSKFSFSTGIFVDFFLLAVAVLLMPLNYFLEGYKWHQLNTGNKSLLDSVKSVFSGCGISLLMPFKWMNFLGWAYHAQPKEWRQLMWSTFPAAFAQNIFTGIFTIIFLPLLFNGGATYSITFLYYTLVIVLTLFLFLFYYKFFSAPFRVELLGGKVTLQSAGFERKILTRVAAASWGRYLVFLGQYMAVFAALGIELSVYEVLVGTVLTMGLTSFFPISLLGKIGIRESIALAVFGQFLSGFDGHILLATLLIWFVNIVLPALAGGWIIIRNKKPLWDGF